MTDIKVTQADREAAVNLLGGSAPKGLLEGKSDSLSVIQAFARHRIEAQRPLLEALEMARRGLTADDVEPLEAMSILIMVDDAIKQAKGE